MQEVLNVILKCVGMILMTITTAVIIPAIKDWRQTKLTSGQREQLTFWVETFVLWAKQWLQNESGEHKKAQVMFSVKQKVRELGLPFSDEDIDKCIEAVYNTVKDVAGVTAGRG